jgi:hypothetical protein
LAITLVPAVKADRVSRKEPSHQGSQRNFAGSGKEMGMVGNENPGITCRLGLREQFCEAAEEIFAILVVSEDLSTLYPPDHDVMKNCGCVESC